MKYIIAVFLLVSIVLLVGSICAAIGGDYAKAAWLVGLVILSDMTAERLEGK